MGRSGSSCTRDLKIGLPVECKIDDQMNVQKRVQNRPKTAPQIPETSIYSQIVIRKTAKKGVQN
jgi:hypothetical protein